MVNYRKYRSRRYGRRGNRRTLSSYSIATRTGAKAQSRQIYALRRRITRIQRLTKPEIMIAPLVNGALSMSDGTTPTGYTNIRVFAGQSLSNIVSSSTANPGASVGILDGRFARLQSITLKGILTYDTNALVGDDYPPMGADLQRSLAMMRVVIIQLKNTRSSGFPSPSDVWSFTSAGSNQIEGTNYLTSLALMRAPLRLGLGRIAKVLSDKTYMLSDTRQAVNIKTKLRYLKPWYRSPTEDIAKGAVAMYVMMYGETSWSDPVFDYVSKCAYTDA